jgi:ElaB/YqjD/DUF883 family membrane-anchored ribosome-binding protein
VDQAASTGRTERLSDQPREPEQIRAEIEEVREELGDTVEALAAKTDVKARVKETAAGIRSAVTQKKDDVVGKTKEAAPGAAEKAARTAREHPVPLMVGFALVLGFVVGRVAAR